MILDRLAHSACYDPLGARIAAAFRFLREQDLAKLPDGRIEIDRAGLYAVVSGYETRAGTAGGVWEAHRRYVDIQCLIEGIEKIGHADRAALNVTQIYDNEKDCELLQGRGQFFKLQPQCFAVFFPQDAHMPGRAAGRPAPVRKIVVKVLV